MEKARNKGQEGKSERKKANARQHLSNTFRSIRASVCNLCPFGHKQKFFRKKNKIQTSTTNGRKNAETARPKTKLPMTTIIITIATNANQISITVFLRSASRTRARSWDCPLFGFGRYRFFSFFTRFSRCFTWFLSHSGYVINLF